VNDPLNHPARVVDIPNERTLVLEDGRRIQLEREVPDLRGWICRSDYFVENGAGRTLGDSTIGYEVFVKHSDAFICGTPYAKLISIPIFPDRIIPYERVSLSLAGRR
jgi:hypothetical protein